MQPQLFDRRGALIAGLSTFGGLALVSARARGAVRVFAADGNPKRSGARTLVLVQLSGGNDGLSTVVPYACDAYQRARPTLALTKKDVIVLDEHRGLHPALANWKKLFDRGHLAIVEGAGYPNPIRSHFKSYEIWHTADPRGRSAGDGWIGRLCDAAWAQEANPDLVVHVGANVPYSLHSSTHPPAAFVDPASYRWAGAKSESDVLEEAGTPARDASQQESSLEYLRRVASESRESSQKVRAAVAHYATTVAYPDDALAASFRDVAALIAGELGTRVLSVEVNGFDTHTNQRARHDALMRSLDGALGAFIADLERSEAGRNTVVLVFSEFGRRIHENGARGTDHGVAAPMFVAGAHVKGGLYGKTPSFEDLDAGDLKHTIDFRCVYATLIERWFGANSKTVLRAGYPMIDGLV